jgi:hypothetical protein
MYKKCIFDAIVPQKESIISIPIPNEVSDPEIGFRPLSIHKSLLFREEGAKSCKIG